MAATRGYRQELTPLVRSDCRNRGYSQRFQTMSNPGEYQDSELPRTSSSRLAPWGQLVRRGLISGI